MKLWQFRGSMSSQQAIIDMVDAKPPLFEFVNQNAVQNYRFQIDQLYPDHDQGEHGPLANAGMPTPVFRIRSPTFALDYFDWGVACMSARLRAALGDVADCVRYHPVNVDGSSPSVQEQDYRQFDVTAIADAIDRSQLPGRTLDFPRSDGSVRQEWFLGVLKPGERLRWRDNFRPPAALFRVKGTSWVMATDELADRVVRAGVRDVEFQDLTSDMAQKQIVLREP